jgi:hypothetical protein
MIKMYHLLQKAIIIIILLIKIKITILIKIIKIKQLIKRYNNKINN